MLQRQGCTWHPIPETIIKFQSLAQQCNANQNTNCEKGRLRKQATHYAETHEQDSLQDKVLHDELHFVGTCDALRDATKQKWQLQRRVNRGRRFKNIHENKKNTAAPRR